MLAILDPFGSNQVILCPWAISLFQKLYPVFGASQVVLVIKNPPASAEDARDEGLIPGLGRSPGVGNSSLLQYSCLENPMDGGAW